MTAFKFHDLPVANITPEAAGAVAITFQVPEDLRSGFNFKAGQFLTLRAIIDGNDVRRSYSICAGLDDAILQVGIKKVAGGAFSTWANEVLQVGDELQVMMPMGNFTTAISADNKKHNLFLSILILVILLNTKISISFM